MLCMEDLGGGKRDSEDCKVNGEPTKLGCKYSRKY